MYKLLPVLICFFSLASLTAQVTLSSDYFPQAGDTLRTVTADSTYAVGLNQLSAGIDREWNFGTPVAEGARLQAVVSTEGDTLFPIADVKILAFNGTLSYYKITETSFDLVGVQTQVALFPDLDITAAVTPSRPTRRAPLTYQDVFTTETSNSIVVGTDSLPEAVLEALGPVVTSIDSLRITTISNREDLADAYGTLVLGTNTFEVLRERRNENIYIRLEAKNNALQLWGDVTALAIAQAPQVAPFLGQQPATTTYTYWSPGEIDPIVEFITDGETGVVQNMEYKQPTTSTSTGGPALLQASIRVFPNPATDLATFEIEGLERGRYFLSLVNTMGQKVKSREFTPLGNQTRLNLDVSALPQGMYMYSLRNERGRTIATKILRVH
ncbi:T9SS type A sorting domain-containing protein [Neolewinella persica]|uniref:T9SS type A sorting domain-containing protein n=1 Tax=Neolewinella persica TaxID=70998 RepID=UPI00037D6873|nr:T9SS type A sorting domain-containing protein [Neolewinella persica]